MSELHLQYVGVVSIPHIGDINRILRYGNHTYALGLAHGFRYTISEPARSAHAIANVESRTLW